MNTRKPGMVNRAMAPRVERVNEKQAQKIREDLKVNESSKRAVTSKLREKWEDYKGLDLGNGKLDKIFESSQAKGETLLRILENTEKSLSGRTGRLLEDMTTSGFTAPTPFDVLKIVRLVYSNVSAPELYGDSAFFGMNSPKDTILKLESVAGETLRGTTAGDVTYENFLGNGQYPSNIETQAVATTALTDTYTATLSYPSLVPFQVRITYLGDQVATDDGSGNLVGATLDSSGTNTIDYTTGDVTITFASGTVTTTGTDDLLVNYAFSTEDSTQFGRWADTTLQLKSFDFVADMWPMTVQWTRMAEMYMEGTMGMDVKDQLIEASISTLRQGLDQYFASLGIVASGGNSSVGFSADWASASAASPNDYAQTIFANAIVPAQLNASYASLKRSPKNFGLLCSLNGYQQIRKYNGFVAETGGDLMGIAKMGTVDGHPVFLAPEEVVPADTTTTGSIYLMGHAAPQNATDSIIMVGTYKAEVQTGILEKKNFNSEMGLGFVGQAKMVNKKFATKIEVTGV